jgi:hypothetical protein
MATDDYGQNITLMSLSDAPSIPKAIADLAAGTIPRGVMRFASATTRGATLAGASAPVEGMVTWLMDVNRLEVYDGSAWVTPPQPVTTTTTGATAAGGFTLVSFQGWKTGHLSTINLAVARSGSNIVSDGGGSIPDTAIGTLPADWRPPDTVYAGVGDGFGNGECSITTAGLVSIRSWSSNSSGSATVGIVTGRFLRVTKTFIQP